MNVQANLTALRQSPGFIESLLPDSLLVHFRSKFDGAGKNVDPSKFAEATKRINKYNNKCAKLVRKQYFPIIKNLVVALLKDQKLSAQADNAKVAGSTWPSLAFENLYYGVNQTLTTAIMGSNAYLHIANAVKPMILKALKELEAEHRISVQRPRRKRWGGVCTYEWADAL